MNPSSTSAVWIVDHAEDPTAARSVCVRATSAPEAAQLALKWHRATTNQTLASPVSEQELELIWPDDCLEAAPLLVDTVTGCALWHAGDGAGELEAYSSTLRAISAGERLFCASPNAGDSPELIAACSGAGVAQQLAVETRLGEIKLDLDSGCDVTELVAQPGSVSELSGLS